MKHITRICLILWAVSTNLALTGCGGGSSGSAPQSVALSQEKEQNHHTITEDTYGLQSATFLSSSRSDDSLSLRAAIASSLNDPDFRTVFRVDILRPEKISGPGAFYIGEQPFDVPKFPGEITAFNGRKSTLLSTVAGTVIFTSYGTNTGDLIAGNFDIRVEDRNSVATPKPAYTIKATFSYVVNSSSRIVPTPSPVPVTAAALYDAKCASCHALGAYDATSNGAQDISLRGGELGAMLFPANATGHGNLNLSGAEIHDLKIFLNAN